jgi:hypothetical protein
MSDVQEQMLREVPGASDVISWFGYWPSFHDAEVVSLFLDRNGKSHLKIHFFNVLAELTNSGRYKTNLHAIVTFSLTNILAMELADFNQQNVLSSLVVTKTDDGFGIELGCCYGLCGSIRAEKIGLGLEPGIPEDSIYSQPLKA